MMDRNLRAKIRQLSSYITDKSAVMQYINRERNLNLTLRDIEDACIGQRDYRPNLEAMTPSPLIVTHKRKGYDDLALALFKYHAARSYGPEQVYWLDRLNDKRAKPSTTLEI
jgi:hypothetical protein